jgi:ABC-type transporter Mla subunit MlaD
MTETFMSELKATESKLETKTQELAQLGKDLAACKAQLSAAIQAKTEAENNATKLKSENDKKLADLALKLDSTLKLRRDSSAKRLEAENKQKELSQN